MCNNNYFFSCWLSNDNGTIWAFVAPMILIITVSVSFYSTVYFYFNDRSMSSFMLRLCGVCASQRSWKSPIKLMDQQVSHNK